jgi:hypothetical protein
MTAHPVAMLGHVLPLTAIDKHGNAAHRRSTVSFEGLLMTAQHYGSCKRL